MTPDEAREIAIRKLRGHGVALSDQIEAAAVLEAQANVEERAGMVRVGGISEEHSCGCSTAKDYYIKPCETHEGYPKGWPEANVEEKKAAFLEAMLRDAKQRPWGYTANDPTYRALVASEKESASKKEDG